MFSSIFKKARENIYSNNINGFEKYALFYCVSKEMRMNFFYYMVLIMNGTIPNVALNYPHINVEQIRCAFSYYFLHNNPSKYIHALFDNNQTVCVSSPYI